MSEQILDGDAAMAYGALAAGVKLVASYPGSPSSGTVEFLISRAEDHGLYIEWSSNEKVAMELAIGASIAGRRALVCVKSVGMNAMLDPLMVLNLTPVHGGLVILLGDDPGGYGSQNDQDTRSLAPLLEVPWLEPAGPAEGLAMMRAAFDASEQLHLPLILRETRSFAQQLETVDVPEGPYRQPDLGLARSDGGSCLPRGTCWRSTGPYTSGSRALGAWVEGLPFNRVGGSGSRGIVAAGFAYRKLLDVLGESEHAGLRLLKLAALPAAGGIRSRFLAGCGEVLVLEENEPFLEERLKALAHERGLPARILGKSTGHIRREGELFRWQIQRALGALRAGHCPGA